MGTTARLRSGSSCGASCRTGPWLRSPTATSWRAAASSPAEFAALGARAGDIVIVILPHSPDLFCAFFGAVLGGQVPSILSPPSFKLNREHYRAELEALLLRIDAKVVVTDAATAAVLEAQGDGWGRRRCCSWMTWRQGPRLCPTFRPRPTIWCCSSIRRGARGSRRASPFRTGPSSGRSRATPRRFDWGRRTRSSRGFRCTTTWG